MMKKHLIGLLSASLLFTSQPVTVVAGNMEFIEVSDHSVDAITQEDYFREEDTQFKTLSEDDLSPSENTVSENSLSENILPDGEYKVAGAGEYPYNDIYGNVYDARLKGIVSPAKVQNKQSCSAYAATACLESAAIRAGLADSSIDLSERYLCKKVTYRHIQAGINALIDGDGITLESNYPSDKANWDGNTELDESVSKPVFARIGTIETFPDDTSNDRFDIEEQIKDCIRTYGTAYCGYRMGTLEYGTGHAVQLVGWSEENGETIFIAKDSMMGAFRDFDYKNGYKGAIDDIFGYTLLPADSYDTALKPVAITLDGNTFVYKFKVEGTQRQQVTYAGIHYLASNGTHTCQIYTNCKEEDNPYSGTPVFSQPRDITVESCHTKFETTKISNTVYVNPGEYVYLCETSSYDRDPLAAASSPYFRIYTKSTGEPAQDLIQLTEKQISISATESGKYIHSSIINPSSQGRTLQYASLDTGIATVNAQGYVSPVAGGTTYIRVSNGVSEAYCKVTVYRNLATVTAQIPQQTYTGLEIKAVPNVTFNGKVLVKDTDYSITSYSNNTNAGSATVTLTGKGFYSGTKTVNFTIAPRSLNDTTVTGTSLEYRPDGQYEVLAYNGFIVSKDNFTSTMTDNNAGNGKMIRYTGKNNYTGTKSVTINITPVKVQPSISFEKTDKTYSYTGQPIVPDMKVTAIVKGQNITLVKDRDYELICENNTEPYTSDAAYAGRPQPSVTVKLINNYKEKSSAPATLYFYIAPSGGHTGLEPGVDTEDLSNAVITDDFVFPFSFNRKEINPVVVLNGKTLKKDVDYTLKLRGFEHYLDIIDIDLNVEVNGIGNYTGTQVITYQTVPRNASDVVLTIDDAEYNGSAVIPVYHISIDGRTIDSDDPMNDIDCMFTVEVTNNNAPGTGTLTLTGYNTFTGTISKDFTITGETAEPEPEPTPEPVPEPEPTPEPAEPEKPSEEQTDSRTLVKTEKIALSYSGKLISTNTRIATVSKKGLVTAKNTGECDIKSTDGKFICHIKVEQPVFPKKITVIKGDTAFIQPTGTTLTSIYTSKKSTVASITEDGTITGINKGKTTIKAAIHNKSYSIQVTVVEPKISQASLYLKPNGAKKITLNGGYKGNVKWSSSDSTVLTVTDSGKTSTTVRALSVGKATVTAAVGDFTYTCEVVIQNPHFAEKTMYLTAGDNYNLNILDTVGEVTYKSSKPAVASVDENGTVTAHKKGKTTITAVCSGNKKTTMRIKVME